MATTFQTLQTEANQIAGEYEAFFAGQSRVTRDLGKLNELVNRMRRVQQDMERVQRSVPAAQYSELRDLVKQNLSMFETERKEIVRLKSLGADFEDFDALRTQANLTFAYYRRHFADKARATRDLGLLAEMIEDLERIHEDMSALAPNIPAGHGTKEDLDTVAGNLQMYRTERGEIVEARGMGTAEEQASALAECANGQFRLYDTHFAGKSRVTRRPALLQRMIDTLTQVHDRMRTLRDQGLRADFNDQNMRVVEESLQTYKNELVAIRSDRERTKFADLQGMLGGAANEAMSEYATHFAGQDRRTRDLQLLSDICDRLGEIGRQMWELGGVEPTDVNTRNLQIVTDQRVLFEREYTQVEETQRNAGTRRT